MMLKICNNISTDNHLEIEFSRNIYDSLQINELAESRLKAIQPIYNREGRN